MRRSPFRYRSSALRYGRYGRGVPLRGPFAIIFLVGILLFFVFFILNFVFALTLENYFETFGYWFFFIPFGIMAILVPTMIIGSIITMIKNPQSLNPSLDPLSGIEGGLVSSFVPMAQQAGYQVTILKNNDPSTAQYLIQNDQMKILVKILQSRQPYQNGMVQDLSKGLGTFLAQEAWVVQNPPTFHENDQNFARFYNVKLLTETDVTLLLKPR